MLRFLIQTKTSWGRVSLALKKERNNFERWKWKTESWLSFEKQGFSLCIESDCHFPKNLRIEIMMFMFQEKKMLQIFVKHPWRSW